MTAKEFAALVGGRRSGRGYAAKCSAHEDRTPSLSIAEGEDGRVLVKCHAGCAVGAILEALGLGLSDLFTGPPPTPEQAREAVRQRRIAEAEEGARRLERRRLADHYRGLNDLADAIGARMANMPEGTEGDQLAIVFHATLDWAREIEAIYERQETLGSHDRLVRYCDRHHIDYQKLLALFMDEERDQHTEAA